MRVKAIHATNLHSVPVMGQNLGLGLTVWGGDPRLAYDAIRKHLRMETAGKSIPTHDLEL